MMNIIEWRKIIEFIQFNISGKNHNAVFNNETINLRRQCNKEQLRWQMQQMQKIQIIIEKINNKTLTMSQL